MTRADAHIPERPSRFTRHRAVWHYLAKSIGKSDPLLEIFNMRDSKASGIIISALVLSGSVMLLQGCNCPLESCALTKDGKCYEPVPDREKRPVKESSVSEGSVDR